MKIFVVTPDRNEHHTNINGVLHVLVLVAFQFPLFPSAGDHVAFPGERGNKETKEAKWIGARGSARANSATHMEHSKRKQAGLTGSSLQASAFASSSPDVQPADGPLSSSGLSPVSDDLLGENPLDKGRP